MIKVNRYSLLFFGFLPGITVSLCFLYPFLAAYIYPCSKAFQLYLVYKFGKFGEGELRNHFWWGLSAGLLMSLVPAICIAMGLLGYLDPEPLRVKLQELGVLDYFFAFVLALSLLNSALEELFFRCFLFERQQFFSKKWTYIYHGLIFVPHHLVALSKYFTIYWNILFNIVLFFAAVIWCYLRDRGMSFLGLWISHVICDLVVLYYAGSKLLFP